MIRGIAFCSLVLFAPKGTSGPWPCKWPEMHKSHPHQKWYISVVAHQLGPPLVHPAARSEILSKVKMPFSQFAVTHPAEMLSQKALWCFFPHRSSNPTFFSPFTAYLYVLKAHTAFKYLVFRNLSSKKQNSLQRFVTQDALSLILLCVWFKPLTRQHKVSCLVLQRWIDLFVQDLDNCSNKIFVSTLYCHIHITCANKASLTGPSSLLLLYLV